MKQTKYLLTVVSILFSLFVFGSCTNDDDGIGEHVCPEPSEVSGKYVYCVWGNHWPEDVKAIVKDGTTPIGLYEAGTQITVEAVSILETCHFYGWYFKGDGFSLGPISHENPYTFYLFEDTYIFAEYAANVP